MTTYLRETAATCMETCVCFSCLAPEVEKSGLQFQLVLFCASFAFKNYDEVGSYTHRPCACMHPTGKAAQAELPLRQQWQQGARVREEPGTKCNFLRLGHELCLISRVLLYHCDSCFFFFWRLQNPCPASPLPLTSFFSFLSTYFVHFVLLPLSTYIYFHQAQVQDLVSKHDPSRLTRLQTRLQNAHNDAEGPVVGLQKLLAQLRDSIGVSESGSTSSRSSISNGSMNDSSNPSLLEARHRILLELAQSSLLDSADRRTFDKTPVRAPVPVSSLWRPRKKLGNLLGSPLLNNSAQHVSTAQSIQGKKGSSRPHKINP